ncbi:MAG: hypothetical protein ACO213_03560, partial [Steroidobacteraceae bacterium]
MSSTLGHGLDLPKSIDQRARERFVSSFRAYILNDLAGQLRDDYEANVAPELGVPQGGVEVHRALLGRESFARYSSLRCAAQEMVWRSFIGIAVMCLFLALSSEGFAQVRTARLTHHIGRNVIHFFGQYCWYTAVTMIPLAQ